LSTGIKPAMSEKKVALVTGANKGLGLEIARQLGKQGITVVLGARGDKAKKAAETLKAEGIDAHPVTLEVTNAADVAALPGYFEKTFGRLDILVNNAGVNLDPEGDSLDVLKRTYEVNVFAPYAITKALLPLLEKSPAGRVVNQSSILGSLETVSSGGAGKWIVPAYSSSKAALNMLSVTLAQGLKDTKVKVNAAHPGWVKTDMGGDGAPLEVADGAKTAVLLATLPADGPSGTFTHAGKELAW
jgi:NAD(P)-dependent dehydrogenase (short-subunit alcohol dehydrogenase family)